VGDPRGAAENTSAAGSTGSGHARSTRPSSVVIRHSSSSPLRPPHGEPQTTAPTRPPASRTRRRESQRSRGVAGLARSSRRSARANGRPPRPRPRPGISAIPATSRRRPPGSRPWRIDPRHGPVVEVEGPDREARLDGHERVRPDRELAQDLTGLQAQFQDDAGGGVVAAGRRGRDVGLRAGGPAVVHADAVRTSAAHRRRSCAARDDHVEDPTPGARRTRRGSWRRTIGSQERRRGVRAPFCHHSRRGVEQPRSSRRGSGHATTATSASAKTSSDAGAGPRRLRQLGRERSQRILERGGAAGALDCLPSLPKRLVTSLPLGVALVRATQTPSSTGDPPARVVEGAKDSVDRSCTSMTLSFPVRRTTPAPRTEGAVRGRWSSPSRRAWCTATPRERPPGPHPIARRRARRAQLTAPESSTGPPPRRSAQEGLSRPPGRSPSGALADHDQAGHPGW